jgi:hypothetical protein
MRRGRGDRELLVLCSDRETKREGERFMEREREREREREAGRQASRQAGPITVALNRIFLYRVIGGHLFTDFHKVWEG